MKTKELKQKQNKQRVEKARLRQPGIRHKTHACKDEEIEEI